MQQDLKRKRIPTACENCRNRKVGCDGALPTCRRCAKRQETCEYLQRPNKLSMAYVKELEKKLGIVDDSVIQTKSIDSHASSELSRSEFSLANSLKGTPPSAIGSDSGAVTSPTNLRTSLWYIVEKGNGTTAPEVRERSKDTNSVAEGKEDSLHIDAMGADSNILKGQEVTKEFYGSSAAMSFMRVLSGSMDSQMQSGHANICKNRQTKYRLSGYKGTISNQETWVFPPRSIADRYVERYFRYVYPLYPFVHKTSFMSVYEEIWTSNGTKAEESDLFYCIVNLIFALGCHHNVEAFFDAESPSSQEKEGNAEAALVYFERSQKYLTFEIMEKGSLLLIQTLLLRGQYLQATYRAEGCWNTIGLAIRVAQGLGLHMNYNVASKGSFIEQEVCKRVWHGCLMMDRIVSMTFGRPLMVTSPGNVDLPLAVDDELITDTEIKVSNPDDKCELRFFLESLKLFGILSEILQRFYLGQDHSDSMGDPFPSIFQFEQKLQEFEEGLPYFLRRENPEQDHPFRRQAIILRARYLHLKIMLYRPILLPDSRIYNDSVKRRGSELYRGAKEMTSKACVDSAIQLVSLLHTHMNRPFLLPASWYNVFYIYTSAMVLLAAKLQTNVSDLFQPKVLRTTWKNALGMLGNVQTRSGSALGCLKILTEMHKRIPLRPPSNCNAPSVGIEPESTAFNFDLNPGIGGSSDLEFAFDSDLFFTTICEGTGAVGPDFTINGT
ncbi:unnamed protein product [Kuraishia capsulata CBS 1993]|uniref:Zn(2)-C6 fungal-type domain-containing protein n=1 Tax=Kuraishia capsulata CBS 1993 TaxID=1382522 RepID=W6MVF9_9ASCO|nr:uncharacterized protein KUCA_T00002231001 [Kuraishia capsulata CBS 1993]CDK26260.1 unnamed protein product [Kuraishia capsulata CBS 1993]